jgi:hypothetical protein
MMGVRKVVKWDHDAIKLLVYASENVSGAISLMSAPAEQGQAVVRRRNWRAFHTPAKAFSLPVMTIAPVLLSSSNFVKASFSSLNSRLDSALSALGLFSVTSLTVSFFLSWLKRQKGG